MPAPEEATVDEGPLLGPSAVRRALMRAVLAGLLTGTVSEVHAWTAWRAGSFAALLSLAGATMTFPISLVELAATRRPPSRQRDLIALLVALAVGIPAAWVGEMQALYADDVLNGATTSAALELVVDTARFQLAHMPDVLRLYIAVAFTFAVVLWLRLRRLRLGLQIVAGCVSASAVAAFMVALGPPGPLDVDDRFLLVLCVAGGALLPPLLRAADRVEARVFGARTEPRPAA